MKAKQSSDIDLGDSLKADSKHKRRKATRYGKPLPESVANSVATICDGDGCSNLDGISTVKEIVKN